ncbi:MAG: ribulose-phosphate 3-epimerase [Candidatus Latescibacteria bacterium]|nr:ribulose-phosphate 3-epimerase [Candidatus Latescibacterota bacterium]
MTTKIAPSILAANFQWLQREIVLAEEGGADLFHLDVMDGRFVPNISFGPMVIETVKKSTNLPLDVHLMVEAPRVILRATVDAGADSVTVHAELSEDIGALIEDIRRYGVNVGVSIKPRTPVDDLIPYLGKIDVALIMSVEPGFGGQPYIPSSTEKIAALRRLIDSGGYHVEIEVDGGIVPAVAREVAKAGGNILAVGSSVFRGQSIAQNIMALREA